MIRSASLAMVLGSVSLALLLGALGFQYLGGIPPCEMCHWQRWPHIAAAIAGLGGGLLVRFGYLDSGFARPLAWCAVFLIAVGGGLGVYHAGVEWHWWTGPQACTGNAFRFNGGRLDLNAPVVMCDVAAWRLFGLSLAGYNAIVSLATAAIGSYFLMARKTDT
ncbi:MAG TPA: disulfide bond formation protein B [Rhizomicrobium sp.]